MLFVFAMIFINAIIGCCLIAYGGYWVYQLMRCAIHNYSRRSNENVDGANCI